MIQELQKYFEERLAEIEKELHDNEHQFEEVKQQIERQFSQMKGAYEMRKQMLSEEAKKIDMKLHPESYADNDEVDNDSDVILEVEND